MTLSHLRAVAAAYAQGDQVALILEDDMIMDDGLSFDGLYARTFDALPEYPCDDDFEITRYALLGPVYGSMKKPQRKLKPAGALATSRPTAETRDARLRRVS